MQDTVVVVTVSPAPPPAVAIDPLDATPHVAVRTSTGYLHLWRQAGIWQQETIAPAGSAPGILGLEWAIGATGRPALLYRGAAGELIVSRPNPSVWQPDTLALPAAGFAGFSLALDPTTDQPVVAWATSDGVTARLRIARRGVSGWQMSQIDSASSTFFGHPSLALDAAGRPRLAMVRYSGPSGPGAYYAEANATTGPWTWALASADVDPGGAYAPHTSLALDAVSAEPRIVWVSTGWLGYASRTAGIWTSQTMGSSTWRAPPTLVLDDSGKPRFLVTDEAPALTTTGPAGVQACVSTVTHTVHLFDRVTATGSSPFQEAIIANHAEAYTRALAMSGGRTHLVWRDVDLPTCVPADMIHADDHTVGVPPSAPPGRIALALFPMPLGRSGTASIMLQLDAPGSVTLEIADIAGRRVARRTLDAPDGSTMLRWDLSPLRAGVYQVIARRGGNPVGSTTLVVR